MVATTHSKVEECAWLLEKDAPQVYMQIGMLLKECIRSLKGREGSTSAASASEASSAAASKSPRKGSM